MATAKITVQKRLAEKVIKVDGSPVGHVTGCRHQDRQTGRVHANFGVRLLDGRMIDLTGYSWYADVVAALPSILREAGVI